MVKYACKNMACWLSHCSWMLFTAPVAFLRPLPAPMTPHRLQRTFWAGPGDLGGFFQPSSFCGSVPLSGQRLRKSRAHRALPCLQEGSQPAASSPPRRLRVGMMLGARKKRKSGLSWARTRRSQLSADCVSPAWDDRVDQPEQPG